MMVNDIKALEQRTSADDLLVIHLIKEGTWWRIYEWSVYLYAKLVETTLVEPLKIVRKSKYICCGMPEGSLGKYFKDLKPSKTDDENHLTIFVKDLLTLESITLENYTNNLDEWRETLPLTESKNKNKTAKSVEPINTSNIPFMENDKPPHPKPQFGMNLGLADVLNKILNYPLMTKTPLDNMQFISQIQNELIKYLKI